MCVFCHVIWIVLNGCRVVCENSAVFTGYMVAAYGVNILRFSIQSYRYLYLFVCNAVAARFRLPHENVKLKNADYEKNGNYRVGSRFYPCVRFGRSL